MYRLSYHEIRQNKTQINESAAPAIAPKVTNMNLHSTLNHSSNEKIVWLQKKYPDAIKFIVDHGNDQSNISCDACITGKAKQRLFKNTSGNRYAPLNAISSDTTEPIAQEYIHGNKYLQLLCDAGTGFTMGDHMKEKRAS